MKITKELAKVFRDAEKHVAKWPAWKRSLDPLGNSRKTKTVRVHVVYEIDPETGEERLVQK